MKKPLLIRGARQLLTLGGVRGPRRGTAMRDLGIIQDGALLIVDGKIAEVGTSRRVEHLAAARDADEIEAAGKVILPAFVDCHARLLCAPTGCEDFASACRMVRTFSPQRMEMEARRRLRDFLRHGTTTLLAGCGYGFEETTERKALRVIRGLDGRPIRSYAGFFGGLRRPPDLDSGGLDDACRMLDPIAAKNEAMAVAVSDVHPAADVARFAAMALERGLRVFLETRSGEPISGASAVIGLGELPASACARVAEWAIPAVLLPGESFQRGDQRYAPARELIDAGAAVALATGYDHLLSPTASMPMIQSIACTQMKMSPAEAIAASTINAAWAMGVAGSVGSLEVGKDADLIVTQTGDYRDLSLFFGLNPVAAVVHKGDWIFPRAERID